MVETILLFKKRWLQAMHSDTMDIIDCWQEKVTTINFRESCISLISLDNGILYILYFSRLGPIRLQHWNMSLNNDNWYVLQSTSPPICPSLLEIMIQLQNAVQRLNISFISDSRLNLFLCDILRKFLYRYLMQIDFCSYIHAGERVEPLWTYLWSHAIFCSSNWNTFERLRYDDTKSPLWLLDIINIPFSYWYMQVHTLTQQFTALKIR